MFTRNYYRLIEARAQKYMCLGGSLTPYLNAHNVIYIDPNLHRLVCGWSK